MLGRRFVPMALVMVGSAAAMFLLDPPWWCGFLHLASFLYFLGPYTLLLHTVVHRPPFARGAGWMERAYVWGLGPLFGHSPGSFFVHHIGMHHPENNQATDESATIAYQRDRFTHFLHYWARFFFVGLPLLTRYLAVRGRPKLRRKVLIAEGSFAVLASAAVLLDPIAGLFVFVVPWVALRWLLMCGNWAQHAFVDVTAPNDAYRNSTCLVNAAYNRRCFNDGYHIVHHLQPSLHWTEMPGWFLANLEEFGRRDAVVFDGIANNQVVWWCLMRGDYGRLADHLVDLPQQASRTRDEKIAWLQGRTRGRVGPIPSFFGGLARRATPGVG